MNESKPYLKNPNVVAALWLIAAVLIIGGPILVGLIWENQQEREQSIPEATGDAIATVFSVTEQAWEATRTSEDQQLLLIVEAQRPLVEQCRQLQIQAWKQVPVERPSHVVLWIVNEDNQDSNYIIWHKTEPPPYEAPLSCLTDPLSSFAGGEGGIAIISVARYIVGYYVPEGAPSNATPDIRFPAYETKTYICMTDFRTGTITGADEIILHPPEKVGYGVSGLPIMPGYLGDPNWRVRAEEWVCDIPASDGQP